MRRYVAVVLALLVVAGTPGCIVVGLGKHDHDHCAKCSKDADWCKKCERRVGDDHRCGKTVWCDACRCEVSSKHKCGS